MDPDSGASEEKKQKNPAESDRRREERKRRRRETRKHKTCGRERAYLKFLMFWERRFCFHTCKFISGK